MESGFCLGLLIGKIFVFLFDWSEIKFDLWSSGADSMWPEKDHPNAHKSLSWPWGGTEPRSIILCTGIHWGTGVALNSTLLRMPE